METNQEPLSNWATVNEETQLEGMWRHVDKQIVIRFIGKPGSVRTVSSEEFAQLAPNFSEDDLPVWEFM